MKGHRAFLVKVQAQDIMFQSRWFKERRLWSPKDDVHRLNLISYRAQQNDLASIGDAVKSPRSRGQAAVTGSQGTVQNRDGLNSRLRALPQWPPLGWCLHTAGLIAQTVLEHCQSIALQQQQCLAACLAAAGTRNSEGSPGRWQVTLRNQLPKV